MATSLPIKLWVLKFYCYIFLIGSGILMKPRFEHPPNRYHTTATIPFDWENLNVDTVIFEDLSTGNPLFQLRTPAGIPLFYAQNIFREVCFDQKCRSLKLIVYWNITGRYLGFELSDTQYLSKFEHEPFTPEEYGHLHELLANPYLPLGSISFNELIESPKTQNDGIDAVSGATSNDVMNYVVKGAAFTTYTLWNIVQGATKKRIQDLTSNHLTADLLTLILRSAIDSDQIWGLGLIDTTSPMAPGLEQALLDLVADGEFYPAYTALQVINRQHLQSEVLQYGLFSTYRKVNYSLRKEIINTLKLAPHLSQKVIQASNHLLSHLNGTQLAYFLDLYQAHKVSDTGIYRTVSRLLDHENSFISKQAYQYLSGIPDADDHIRNALSKYARINKQ